MQVISPEGHSFIIFFYAVTAGEKPSARSLYAIDFGVKRHAKMSHLAHFDAILTVFEAVVNTVKNPVVHIRQPCKVSFLHPSQQHQASEEQADRVSDQQMLDD